MKQLFVAWTPFMRRPESMQPHFGYELRFLPFALRRRYQRPIEYVVKGFQTLFLLLKHKPAVLWIQLAPTVLLYLAHLYRLFNPRVTIVADCHNGMFQAPWIKFPMAIRLLNRCDIVLVHNDRVLRQALDLGVRDCRLHVLETKPASISGLSVPKTAFPNPWVLLPCSFDADEPIEHVLAAACLLPDVTFVLTGDPSRAKGVHDLTQIPPNVQLVGFLKKSVLDQLLASTDLVMGLTTWDGVQLSVANEAVGAGKPMVLANTKLLMELFHKGAVYVSAQNAESIAEGCKEALARKVELTQQVLELREARISRWKGQAALIERRLEDLIYTRKL